MTLAQRIQAIDERLAGADLVLHDLASGVPVEPNGPALAAAISDLAAAREMLAGLAEGAGRN